MRIFNLFRRKQFKPQPKQLRIDGCKTVMTAAPDDAELAAQALLESLAGDSGSKIHGSRFKEKKAKDKNHEPLTNNREPASHDAAYYKQLAEKIKKARAAEVRRTKRFLTYAEQQLDSPLMTGQTGEIERELYKLQDVAEREGGELLKRWQHCLAECIVRQMTTTDDADLTDVETTATT